MPTFKEPLKIPHEKILIFEPHPDDIAFQLSGTLCKWMDEKKDVIVCTITTGNSSNMDPSISKEEIEKIMMDEHHAALNFYGIPDENRIQWKYDDWGLDPTRDRLSLLSDMVRLIKKMKPTTVVTMDPLNINMEENPDHRSVAMIGFEAAAMASYPDALINALKDTSLVKPNDRDIHHVSRVLFYMSPNPNVFVDVGGELMDRKKEVGGIYKSQLKMMIEEVDARLRFLGLDPEIRDVDYQELWNNVCESYAKTHAADAMIYYKAHPELAPRVYPEFAEAFRLYYLGAVEKLRDLLPRELLTL